MNVIYCEQDEKKNRTQRRIERDTNRTSTFGAAHVMEHEIILISNRKKNQERERFSGTHRVTHSLI